MLRSTNFHTLFCSISPHNKTLNSSHSPHPPHLLKFRTSHRENLRYLKTLGVISPEAKLHKYPSPQTLSQILSSANYLKSKGFSDPDFSRLAYLCPCLFSPDFSPNDVEPVFDFLATDLSASVEQSCGLLLKCPHILESNVEFCLKPTLVYLRKLGIENLNTPTTLNAHLLNTRVEKFEEKIRFLRRIGLTYEEAANVCVRLPAIFGYSIVNNLGPKFEYLVREMKMGVEDVKGFPQYFAFSLEKRIVPRHCI
ncbi:hypothetical protein RJ639_047427 [Escallonia herrerae]|uniref:Uncharacterized protein n=1 Tax=Escallonia herrerae TaxID=1293975 RepID=A0AA89B206_9ASTE|nr:hypothetical protein RJ639_047427 [Escallonia herrerae]